MGIGLLLIIIVVVLFVAGRGDQIRSWFSENPGTGYNQRQDARDILDARLVRGEITREEYDDLLERITS